MTIQGSRSFHTARLVRKNDGQGFRTDVIQFRQFSCPCAACCRGEACLVMVEEWDERRLILSE